MSAVPQTPPSSTRTLDALVVGAGFAGLYMLHRLRSQGFNARIYEAASGPGGTWFWNRYPGARCDIPSLQYSYQFSEDLQQEWVWAERYASQAEILKYVDHVIERFKLRPDIQFNTRIQAAHFDEASSRWQVTTSTGEQISAKFCIMATGCLSSTNTPDFKGRESFRGKVYHTGQWPHEGVDFTGQRVAVIGTGSSAVQSIPLIAAQAKHLTVFQRTANFSVPAHNAPLDPAEQKQAKANYAELRENGKSQLLAWDIDPNMKLAADSTPSEIRAECERRWRMGGLYFYGTFADLLINPESNRVVAEFVCDKVREKVKDPAVAALLTPKSVLGCKRICADTDYFETYNRENVLLVDISKSGIDEITPDGLSAGGNTYAFDALVFATGFDAMIAQRLEQAAVVMLGQLEHALGLDRVAAAHQAVEQHAQPVHVGAEVDAHAQQLLGRERQRQSVRDPGLADLVGAPPQVAERARIHQDDLAARLAHHARGAHLAMDDPDRMDRGERLAELEPHAPHLARRQRSVAQQEVLERRPREALGPYPEIPVALVGAMDDENVRMAHDQEAPDLVEKARLLDVIARGVHRAQPQRDLAAEHGVVREVDVAEMVLAESGENRERPP